MLVRRVEWPFIEFETSSEIAPIGTLGILLDPHIEEHYFLTVWWEFNGVIYNRFKWARPHFTLVDCPITKDILLRKLGI